MSNMLKEIAESMERRKMGGPWLGKIRNWIQWNCFNGDHVTWGSDDVCQVKGNLTVARLEELAFQIAEEALKEMQQMKKQMEKLRSKNIRLECELHHLKKGNNK